jgi:hypothetical protein
LVQLASSDAATAALAERLIDRVDALLRAAYPRASVTVIFDHSIEVDRIAVVSSDPDVHEAKVRHLIDDARAELGERSA